MNKIPPDVKMPSTPYEAWGFAYDNKDKEWFPSVKKKVEKLVRKSRRYSYLYAKDIIGGRWEVAEDNICKTAETCYNYAINVIKGQLPENMHNMMMLHSLSPNPRIVQHAKNYFKFINN